MRKIVLSIALAALSPPAFAQPAGMGPVVPVQVRQGHTLADTPVPHNRTSAATSRAASAGTQTANPSVWAAIPRYQKTLVATQVTVYVNTCAFYLAGIITFPVQPKYGKATNGSVACTIPQGQVCADHSYGNCAAIYYERTEHNNKSARSPSPDGPIDIFTYK